MPLPRRNLTIGTTIKVNILGEHLRPKGRTCHSYNFPLPFKSKEFLDPGTHGDMEEGIFEIQPHTHGTFTEPFPDHFNVFHMEVVKTVWKWFRKDGMCVGLDLKDAFFHVSMSAQVKKFL